MSLNGPLLSSNDTSTSSNSRKDSTLKLPYPVLSDHRDPSSILILLQKETQTTSKKISDVLKQIEECERRLSLTRYSDNEKKTFKYERVKFKQQLDGLKKHERRVSLQIDFLTTKSEIKGLEDEKNSTESQQIQILLGKLKQKLDKMKIYMRERNEEMKKVTDGKQRGNDLNRKRSSTSTTHSHVNKRLKPATPVIRLTARVTSHESKKPSPQPPLPPIVRFIDKTTNSTSPGSSSSTSSPSLMANKRKTSLTQDDENDDNDLDLELNIDELFNDDSYSEQTVQRLKTDLKHQVKQNT